MCLDDIENNKYCDACKSARDGYYNQLVYSYLYIDQINIIDDIKNYKSIIVEFV